MRSQDHVIKIRKRLDKRISLFGNLDSVSLLRFGTPEEVREETKRQMQAARYGRFVMANGSPLTPDTPKANIRAMMKA